MAKRKDADRESSASRFTWQEGDIQIAATGPRYPYITVRLVGEDGNAFAILGRVVGAMKGAGIPPENEAFRTEATAGDYDVLLRDRRVSRDFPRGLHFGAHAGLWTVARSQSPHTSA